MTTFLNQFWMTGSICLWGLAGLAIARPSFGQSPNPIIPDATQPANSIVTVDGDRQIITGGTTAGGNLFHSFQEFSLPTGTRAIFNNASTIDNIITRVTGGQISNIDGLIQTNGTANLFLLNPNGIIFGQNAALNLGGSFYASTADSVIFANGSEYSATNPQAPPLLNVNVPIGLQLGANPGTIVNRSLASFEDQVVGLAVQPGQTLGLIGGNLNLEGGHLNAIQGKVELAAIINSEWPLSETESSGLRWLPPIVGGREGDEGDGRAIANSQLADIQLSQQAIVNTSGLGGGEIQIAGGLISIDGGSQILANTGGDLDGVGITITGSRVALENGSLISASTFGAGAAGPINITAKEVELIGSGNSSIIEALLASQFNSGLLGNGIFSISGGAGAAGNVTLNVDRLSLTGGAAILTITLSPNKSGDLTINAADSVELLGGSVMITGTTQSGPGGDVNIDTNVLRIRDGSMIATSPSADSQGDGGNLTVNATDLVEITNTPPGRPVPGGLFTVTLGAGNAGDLTVNARQVILRDGSQINASSSGAGIGGNLTVNASDSIEVNGATADISWISGLYTSSSLLDVEGLSGSSPAGVLTVNTKRLTIRNGGIISAASSEGSAGSLQINASESLEVTGMTDTTIPELQKVSSLLANSVGSGEAGDLLIQTGELIVSDRAFITVNGEGTGNAGNLQITAESIQLNDGSLNAATASGEGGNIFLNSQLLQLRDNSHISTEAGGSGNGGNITINTDVVAALENSDIIANAAQGFGGRVIIDSQGIFGTEFREQQTLNSDITATSQLGPQFSGTVEISTPDVEPNAGLVELQTNVVDVQGLVDRDICATSENSFYITGRGGLPPNPDEPLSSDTVWVDKRSTPLFIPLPSMAFIPPLPPFERGETEEMFLFVRGVRGGSTNSQTSTVNHEQIIEATGWAIAPNGQIILTANRAFLDSDSADWLHHPSCIKNMTE